MKFVGENFIFLGMLVDLFSGALKRMVGSFDENDVYEIRLRLNRPVSVITKNGLIKLKSDSGNFYAAKKSDMDKLVGVASDFSVYSVMDEIVSGYLRYDGGIRIGATGEGVCDGGKLISVKNFSSLIVRVPHEIIGCGEEIARKIESQGVRNLLVLSPPNCGKTTVLRDLARIFSTKCQTLVIDERGELASLLDGEPMLDVGESDVIASVPKTVAYENCIRAASPELIVTDEVFKQSEIDSIVDIVRCGVRVFASVHADSKESLEKSKGFSTLVDCFDGFATLTNKPKMGTLNSFDNR